MARARSLERLPPALTSSALTSSGSSVSSATLQIYSHSTSRTREGDPRGPPSLPTGRPIAIRGSPRRTSNRPNEPSAPGAVSRLGCDRRLALFGMNALGELLDDLCVEG